MSSKRTVRNNQSPLCQKTLEQLFQGLGYEKNSRSSLSLEIDKFRYEFPAHMEIDSSDSREARDIALRFCQAGRPERLWPAEGKTDCKENCQWPKNHRKILKYIAHILSWKEYNRRRNKLNRRNGPAANANMLQEQSSNDKIRQRVDAESRGSGNQSGPASPSTIVGDPESEHVFQLLETSENVVDGCNKHVIGLKPSGDHRAIQKLFETWIAHPNQKWPAQQNGGNAADKYLLRMMHKGNHYGREDNPILAVQFAQQYYLNADHSEIMATIGANNIRRFKERLQARARDLTERLVDAKLILRDRHGRPSKTKDLEAAWADRESLWASEVMQSVLDATSERDARDSPLFTDTESATSSVAHREMGKKRHIEDDTDDDYQAPTKLRRREPQTNDKGKGVVRTQNTVNIQNPPTIAGTARVHYAQSFISAPPNSTPPSPPPSNPSSPTAQIFQNFSYAPEPATTQLEPSTSIDNRRPSPFLSPQPTERAQIIPTLELETSGAHHSLPEAAQPSTPLSAPSSPKLSSFPSVITFTIKSSYEKFDIDNPVLLTIPQLKGLSVFEFFSTFAQKAGYRSQAVEKLKFTFEFGDARFEMLDKGDDGHWKELVCLMERLQGYARLHWRWDLKRMGSEFYGIWVEKVDV